MTDLSTEEVKKIAKLANLPLKDEKAEKLAEQFSAILGFVQKLDNVDTGGAVPLPNVLGTKNIFREDIVKPSLTQEEALSGTNRKHRGYFKVKAVFEE